MVGRLNRPERSPLPQKHWDWRQTLRHDPSIELTVPELRERLGIKKGSYKDYAQLKRRVLDQAKSEIDHFAHFSFNWEEVRHGRKVLRVRLRFWKKIQEEIDSTAGEFKRSRAGRKSRRKDTAEKRKKEQQKIENSFLADKPSGAMNDYLDDEILFWVIPPIWQDNAPNPPRLSPQFDRFVSVRCWYIWA